MFVFTRLIRNKHNPVFYAYKMEFREFCLLIEIQTIFFTLSLKRQQHDHDHEPTRLFLKKWHNLNYLYRHVVLEMLNLLIHTKIHAYCVKKRDASNVE